ncbi:Rieske (2Fe-2S) protein [Nakamurella endophytica]|uniref:Rieske domain-containing protein n=1 Tax=Nakamurella endophytica TaxID=1748367 RepID=A0A917SMM9_9ACTN|nr:Rieske 2Fe-2S domain-containing protein [Nakamurella endophytica]GGL90104.1 hypothetical protein GCM10011594_07230 [Nakamurella endophytica]
MTAATTVNLGPVDQIPLAEGRAFAVDGRQIAVFRLRDGTVRALDAVCPHRGGPLADGQLDAEVVLCPLHMNAYRLADGCSTTGQPPVAAYQVTVDDHGDLRVQIG